MNTDRRSSFSSRVFVKCPLKMDVGYLETEILIVFEDQPAVSKHVQIFTSIAENLPFRYMVNGKKVVTQCYQACALF